MVEAKRPCLILRTISWSFWYLDKSFSLFSSFRDFGHLNSCYKTNLNPMEEVAALGEGFSLGFSLLRISPSQRGVSLLHFQNVAMCEGVGGGAFFEFSLISKKILNPSKRWFQNVALFNVFLNRCFPLGIKKLMSWRWSNALANSISVSLCRESRLLYFSVVLTPQSKTDCQVQANELSALRNLSSVF